MISKKHFLVLKVLNDNCILRDSCLIEADKICAFIGDEKLVSEKNVDFILKDLSRLDYIDLIKTNKKGCPIYCITLLKKGKNYKEERKKIVVDIKNKILLAILGGSVSYIVGKFLVMIFK